MNQLTPEERRRFAEWLEHQILQSRTLCDQLGRLGGAATYLALTEEMAFVKAAQLIARRLRSSESQSI